ncbi:gamma-glutamyl-gamma-aminobutyrate hydrolase family protein [Engelhardtia mirabilis]|uniref:Glutamine amidotransferase n=1 Tax=Engelhardtia mirabilis TaxID=2528011 RepID=A0A518BSH9_9BACT|nr:Putative glutamine amidotransferase [Planctomycetes bacterium Pla133]QDV04262.1 Putative glutamine amidotransferase [Planctomycetes bacterium Pla86]
MQPTIGLIGGLEERRVWRVDLPLRYGEAVRRAGAVPVGLYPTTDAGELAAQLEALDGLVLTGGDDFDTERLGLGPTHPSATPVPTLKQDADLELVRAALELGLPLLGICYGMQLMALAGGGELFQHLPEDRPGCAQHSGDTVHGIVARGGTKLARIVGVEPLAVVSRHHQAISGLGGAWRVAATDDEGLIEAVELDGDRFVLGTQWHPELSTTTGALVEPHDRNARLFEALVSAARDWRAQRSARVRASAAPPTCVASAASALPGAGPTAR